ncbi:DUF3833 domain-containing protein [Lacibacterium aquatile]|uniref:DUF3833 domain-containing protein n=1 Tax=Lacibacterium aquatile TaxID=1168082 RepID=A0ABW5DL88_9PROT
MMKVTDFANHQPTFLPEEFFKGGTKAWGIFEDRFGRVRRQFSVDITGTWDGYCLTLDESFLYDDSQTDTRIWRIRKNLDGTYAGEADDVVGVAEGVATGNAFNWSYVMDLKIGNGTLRVAFDDWMFLQRDGVVINRARVRKWGIELGQVTLFFTKTEATNAFSPT